MASLLRLVNCSNVQKPHQHFDRRSPQSKSASSLLPAMKPHVRVDLGDGIGTRLSRLNIDSNPADAYTHDTLCMLPTLSLWFRERDPSETHAWTELGFQDPGTGWDSTQSLGTIQIVPRRGPVQPTQSVRGWVCINFGDDVFFCGEWRAASTRLWNRVQAIFLCSTCSEKSLCGGKSTYLRTGLCGGNM